MSAKSIKPLDSLDSLCPLDITDLKGLHTDFDVYLDIAGKPVLYADGPYDWSMKEVERLHHDGFSVVFYRKSNDDKVLQLLSRQQSDPAMPDLTPHQILVRCLTSNQEWISKLNLPSQAIEVAAQGTKKVIETIEGNDTLSSNFYALSHHDYYSYYHSLRTAAYGAAISLKLDPEISVEKFHDLILGCLVHDLGHLKVSKEILEKRERLDEKEWFEIKKHPLLGLELLKGVPLSETTKEIILHHHERIDGHGYPHGIKGSSLSQEVKIVTFCDVFDALTSPRPYQTPIDLEEALKFIEHAALEYLDRKSYDAMVTLMNEAKEIETPS